jgi:hypothetical protein
MMPIPPAGRGWGFSRPTGGHHGGEARLNHWSGWRSRFDAALSRRRGFRQIPTTFCVGSNPGGTRGGTWTGGIRIPPAHLFDDYHKPSDTADRIVYDKVARTAHFTAQIALQVASAPGVPCSSTCSTMAHPGSGTSPASASAPRWQNLVRMIADERGIWAVVDDELEVPYVVRYELRPATGGGPGG